MLEAFDALVRELGPWGVVLFGAAALLEYLFPPFPGDTVALLGGAYASRGEHPLWLVLVLLMVFSVAGMALTWGVGRSFGKRLAVAKQGPLLFGLTVEQLRDAQTRMRERGDWVLVLNRFLPSFRAVVFVAAGASGTPLPRVLLLGSASALLWNVLLVFVGSRVGAHADQLEAWLSAYRSLALGVIALALVIFLIRRAWNRRRR
jgi:membrane protein DedA with SNARE-associated domain